MCIMDTKLTSKMTWIQIILVIAFCFLAAFFCQHNDGLYRQPIFRVNRVENGKAVKMTDEFHNVDYYHSQKLYGQITNGTYAGKKFSINNSYSDSHAMDHEYERGQKLFITLHTQPKLHATVKDMKRDAPIAFLFAIAISLLFVILKLRGVTVISSIVINTILFWIAVKIDHNNNGSAVILIFSILAVVFCFVTLLLVMGWSKKMLVTLSAVLCATAATILITLLVFAVTHERGVYYESMQYVTQLPKPLFIAEVLIGVLGAVMDEATDIIASLATLKQERPQLSKMDIFKSGRQIGKSIMGPLINVLFFIFMAETLPMTLLYLKNGNSWHYSFSMNMSLGMTSSLISGIGIVLTVILSSLFAGLWIKGDER
ncbi:YibE/F family protein [Lactobacillus parabuchneri]